MTNLSAKISIYNFEVNTFGLFLIFGFLLLAFVIWNEGKNDGFDEERLFDLLLVSLVSSVFLSRVIFAFYNVTNSEDFFSHVFKIWVPGFNTYGALAGLVLPILLLCKKWKWSVYRISDIFSMGLSLTASIVVLGFVGLQGRFNLLFAFSSYIFLYALLTKIRTSKLKSGYSTIVFLVVTASLNLIFFGSNEYLIFYIVLVTLALVVFLFRWRLDKYESPEFIARIIGGIKTKLRGKKSRA